MIIFAVICAILVVASCLYLARRDVYTSGGFEDFVAFVCLGSAIGFTVTIIEILFRYIK